MALVDEAGFLRDKGQRLIALPHQAFCPIEPPLHDVALRPDPRCLLEGTAQSRAGLHRGASRDRLSLTELAEVACLSPYHAALNAPHLPGQGCQEQPWRQAEMV